LNWEPLILDITCLEVVRNSQHLAFCERSGATVIVRGVQGLELLVETQAAEGSSAR